MDSGRFVYFIRTTDVWQYDDDAFSTEKRACLQHRTYPVGFPERVTRPCGERFGENVSGAQKTHISERFNGSANNVFIVHRSSFFLNFFRNTNRRKISRRLLEKIAANSAKPRAVPVRGF